MEMLSNFIEVCLRKPVVLEDCENKDYTAVTLIELLYVPVLFTISFVTTVCVLLKYWDDPYDSSVDHHVPPYDQGGGDFNLMDVEPPQELYWQDNDNDAPEDYPSPY